MNFKRLLPAHMGDEIARLRVRREHGRMAFTATINAARLKQPLNESRLSALLNMDIQDSESDVIDVLHSLVRKKRVECFNVRTPFPHSCDFASAYIVRPGKKPTPEDLHLQPFRGLRPPNLDILHGIINNACGELGIVSRQKPWSKACVRHGAEIFAGFEFLRVLNGEYLAWLESKGWLGDEFFPKFLQEGELLEESLAWRKKNPIACAKPPE